MSKIVFSGASLTAGYGFRLPEEKEFMWSTLIHKNCFPELEYLNVAVVGDTNAGIFKQTIKTIAENKDLSIIMCSWVSLLRYNFSLGFELYPTLSIGNEIIDSDKNKQNDYKLNTGIISQKYVADIKNRFIALHHYHYEICKLLEYINIINNLCQQLKIIVYHCNDHCPWDRGYFDRLENVKPEQYTEFTKNEILNIKNRDDDEIFKLYKKMHDEYDLAGGIHPASWINLYEPRIDNKVDVNHDGFHPGKKSNSNYFKQVKQFLETQ